AFAGEVGPEPAHHDEEAVAEADQEHDVEKEPEEPGDDPAELHAEDMSYRLAAADGCHRTLIDVFEIFPGAALEFPQDILCSGGAHLHCGGADAGDGLAVLAEQIRHVSDNENVRVAGYRQIRFDLYPPGLVGFNAEPCTQRRRGDARRP